MCYCQAVGADIIRPHGSPFKESCHACVTERSKRKELEKLSTINDRIAQVVQHSGLTKTAFAKRVNISQGFISELCSGKSNPSDRTIVDICREFSVDEVWLRTGEGEMLRKLSRSEEITAYLADILSGSRSPAEEALISALSRVPPEHWHIFEAIIDDFTSVYLQSKQEKDKE